MKDGQRYMTGNLGVDFTVELGYEAARHAALTSLSAVRFALGDLERVAQMFQLIGYVKVPSPAAWRRLNSCQRGAS
jgi:hypothetical protein